MLRGDSFLHWGGSPGHPLTHDMLQTPSHQQVQTCTPPTHLLLQGHRLRVNSLHGSTLLASTPTPTHQFVPSCFIHSLYHHHHPHTYTPAHPALFPHARQVLDWYHDDAYVGLTGRLPAAGDEAGTAVLLATSSQVLLLQPVALEQQVGWGRGMAVCVG